MPTIYTYIRCSHQDSAESGLGLAEQQTSCKCYVAGMFTREPYKDMEGLTVQPDIFVDKAVSAYKRKTRTLVSRPVGFDNRGQSICFSESVLI